MHDITELLRRDWASIAPAFEGMREVTALSSGQKREFYLRMSEHYEEIETGFELRFDFVIDREAGLTKAQGASITRLLKEARAGAAGDLGRQVRTRAAAMLWRIAVLEAELAVLRKGR